MRHLGRRDLQCLFGPQDVVVANDAATLPASLHGVHAPTGTEIEIRLAGWIAPDDPTRFVAVAFGEGDYRTTTEDRKPPPELTAGDRLVVGPLAARVVRLLEHPRLFELRFAGDGATVLAGIASHGRPIQYAHVPAPLAMWDVWTGVAARPVAFEAPSAGFALDWRTLATWRRRGVAFATLTHAAGISSTGDPALDRRLPFDEPFTIPAATAATVRRARATGGRVVAIGTSVVRALESATADSGLRSGTGIARGRIGPHTPLRMVDAILTGMHEPGASHHELLRAFAHDDTLARVATAARGGGYRGHEFGDFLLLERTRAANEKDTKTLL